MSGPSRLLELFLSKINTTRSICKPYMAKNWDQARLYTPSFTQSKIFRIINLIDDLNDTCTTVVQFELLREKSHKWSYCFGVESTSSPKWVSWCGGFSAKHLLINPLLSWQTWCRGRRGGPTPYCVLEEVRTDVAQYKQLENLLSQLVFALTIASTSFCLDKQG